MSEKSKEVKELTFLLGHRKGGPFTSLLAEWLAQNFKKKYLQFFKEIPNLKAFALFMAFYLFFGSLFPKNDFSQLLKLSDLWEHYQEHLLSSAEADWRSFLCEHFIHPEKHDDDQHTDRHQELPLMSLSSSTPIFLLPPTLLFAPAPDQTQIPPLPAYLFSHISPYLNRIFHPPSLHKSV